MGSYAPTGPETAHIVYARSGSLFAAPFDPIRLRVGSPVPVLEGIAGSDVSLAVGFSDSGTLAYVPSSVTLGFFSLATLAWVDRQGKEEPLPAPPRLYVGDPALTGRQASRNHHSRAAAANPRCLGISPDGKCFLNFQDVPPGTKKSLSDWG